MLPAVLTARRHFLAIASHDNWNFLISNLKFQI